MRDRDMLPGIDTGVIPSNTGLETVHMVANPRKNEIMIRSTYRLANRPSERLILIGICEEYGADFKWDSVADACVVSTSDQETSRKVRDKFDAIIAFATKKLAMVRADIRFSNVPAKTIDSNFMKGFADVITGTIVPPRGNVILRKGMLAGMEWLKN